MSKKQGISAEVEVERLRLRCDALERVNKAYKATLGLLQESTDSKDVAITELLECVSDLRDQIANHAYSIESVTK